MKNKNKKTKVRENVCEDDAEEAVRPNGKKERVLVEKIKLTKTKWRRRHVLEQMV